MRIALDTSPLFHTSTSGTGTYLLELAEHLPRVAPNDEFIWFYQAPWRSGCRRRPAGWPACRHLVMPWVPPRLLQLAWRRFGRPSVRYLARDPDVFHLSHIWQPPLGKARGVITIHDLTPIMMPDVHVPGNVEANRLTLRFAAEQASGILVDSESTRRDLLTLAPGVEPRTRVVYLAAPREFRPVSDREELQRALSALGLDRAPYFLFAGVTEPRKNLPGLLRAFATLGREYGEIRLVIAGPPGWGDLSIPEEAARLGIGDRVIATGGLPRPTLRYLMAGALALVYPSLYEGFGIPPLEAMACGTAVITSNVSSLPEVVGDDAVLVDPRSVEELASAMRLLADDPVLRRDLGRRGLERAARFSWQSTARQTADFYQWVTEVA